MTTKYSYDRFFLPRFRAIVARVERIFLYARKRLLDWLMIVVSIETVASLYFLYSNGTLTLPEETSILRDILTINGVFSSILITYLLTRLSWLIEKKQQLHSEAIEHSQKVTEFRRILFRLTRYYNVWHSDAATKALIDHGKYEHLDFHDYRQHWSKDEDPETYQLVDDLMHDPNFLESTTAVYLAMISLIENRKAEGYQYQEELHNDFQYNGTYTLEAVERWNECGLLDSIWYWMNADYKFIQFEKLGNHFDEIQASAMRINSRYQGETLSNKLIEDMSNDVRIHLVHLHKVLLTLRKGLTGWNRMIMVLITTSLLVGVLAPFILVQVKNESFWYQKAVTLVSSINLGLIVYFLLKFPLMISRELKWNV